MAWSADHVLVLLADYPKRGVTVKQIADEVGKSETAVRLKAMRIKRLKKFPVKRPGKIALAKPRSA